MSLTILAQKPTIQIKGDITPHTFISFIDQLRSEIDTKHHRMHIHSPGGVVDAAFDIIDLMKGLQLDGHTFTCVATKAYSAAFSILQACDTRVTTRESSFMQHRVYKLYANLYKFHTWLTVKMDVIQLDLCYRVRIPRELFKSDYIDKERYMTPDEAIRLGVVDKFEYDTSWIK